MNELLLSLVLLQNTAPNVDPAPRYDVYTVDIADPAADFQSLLTAIVTVPNDSTLVLLSDMPPEWDPDYDYGYDSWGWDGYVIETGRDLRIVAGVEDVQVDNFFYLQAGSRLVLHGFEITAFGGADFGSVRAEEGDVAVELYDMILMDGDAQPAVGARGRSCWTTVSLIDIDRPTTRPTKGR